jgi:hypothetical protein
VTPPTFYSYSPTMGEEGVRAASPNLVHTSRRSSCELQWDDALITTD